MWDEEIEYPIVPFDELFNYFEPDLTYESDAWKIKNSSDACFVGYASDTECLDIFTDKFSREATEQVKFVTIK